MYETSVERVDHGLLAIAARPIGQPSTASLKAHHTCLLTHFDFSKSLQGERVLKGRFCRRFTALVYSMSTNPTLTRGATCFDRFAAGMVALRGLDGMWLEWKLFAVGMEGGWDGRFSWLEWKLFAVEMVAFRGRDGSFDACSMTNHFKRTSNTDFGLGRILRNESRLPREGNRARPGCSAGGRHRSVRR